jgi:hypothetical protein
MALLKGIKTITLDDSGEYYTTNPTVRFKGGFADSSDQIKFGNNSLDMAENHWTYEVDSNTSMDGLIAFWLWVDSGALPESAGSNLKPLWEMGVHANGAFRRRFGVNSGGQLQSATKFTNVNSLVTWYNSFSGNVDERIQENQWNHVMLSFQGADQGFATRRADVMINGKRTYYTNSTSFSGFFHDSNIMFGSQLQGDFNGSIYFDSPTGMYMDNLYLDSAGEAFLTTAKAQLFDSDSAGGNWFRSTIAKFMPFDNDSATGRATIDSADKKVNGVFIVDSGFNYVSAPTVEFGGGSSIDSDYRVGDTVKQTLSGNVTITGEIQTIKNDSAGDSSRHYGLAHVGADDGKYHTFIKDTTLINTSRGQGLSGLVVDSVGEDNKISATEQNQTFSTESDDFLDFSENNPFGDPEDQ